ncbi:MAG TPA: efflux RND transporter periplasmic adaptor subunit [Candidatus Acidoferrum sp.]|nr:efflux RND transporter periplasmic adaptor subunit [Candidatus Acidoferrum sp.]
MGNAACQLRSGPGIALAIAVSLGAPLAFVSCSSNAAKDADTGATTVVAAAKAQRADLTRALVISAEFRPFQDIDVHAKVAGYVKHIYVDVGDHVKQGELLAVLEIPELQDEVQTADASVSKSEEEIRRAQADLEQSKSAHQVAHLAYTRLVDVSKTRPGLVAQQELDDASGRDQVTQAQVATSSAALSAANQELRVAQANRERIRTLFAYSQIKAPFAGVITKRYADTGSMIQTGISSQTQSMPLVTLAQENLLRLVLPVPESAVPRIRLGSPVEVTVSSIGKTFEGKVARFADQVDLTTRTMHTEVDIPNPKGILVPGMYATASVILSDEKNALAVPVQALDRTENHVSVLTINSQNKLEERDVKVGVETPNQVEILSGLNEGDLVVIGNRSQLQPGMPVKPRIVALAQTAGGS